MPENEKSLVNVYAPLWRMKTINTSRGNPVSNLANVMLILREDSFWQGVVKFNEMERGVELALPVPRLPFWTERDGVVWEPRALNDVDIALATEWLQKAGLTEVSPAVVHSALELRARECAYHPVRDWLNGLVWDGQPRLSRWLVDYCASEDTEYIRGVGRFWLLALVARIMRPGCQCDYMLVLEGKQGLRKSTVCAVLGGKWFSDSLPSNIESKDTAIHLRGKWLIEIGEMAQMNKADIETLKHFVTKKVEQYRPPYGKMEVIEPRQCVFIATTNEEEYLRDATGDRRFWPVRVGDRLLLEELQEVRDQLFAEAVVGFKAGEPWWPSPEFEETHIKKVQEDRFETDPWEDRVVKFLGKKAKVTTQDVLVGALGVAPKDQGQGQKRRLTAIMRRLGWRQVKSNAERFWSKH